MRGSIFDIQRFAVHDGPGIRTLVFLKGCPLSCRWCSNPESQDFKNEIMLIDKECIGTDKCHLCFEACEHNAIEEKDQDIFINRELCAQCGRCAIKCPSDALRNTKRLMTSGEVTEYVMKDIDFYNRSGGGVTLSGGEPLFQYEFCMELLKSFKKRRLHVAVETTVYCDWEKLKATTPFTDLYLVDIKHMNAAMHETYTGVKNELIIKNLKKLVKEGSNVEIRIPLIPGINDQKTNLLQTGKFVKHELGLSHISLLPYHRLGQSKYEQLGKAYLLKSINPINPSRNQKYFQGCQQILEDCGLNTSVGG